MAHFPSEGVLCEYTPGRVMVGAGPLEPKPTRVPDRPAVYAPDFFLDDPAPWLHAAAWHDLTRREVTALLPPLAHAPQATWTAPDREDYVHVFAELQRQIASGSISKAVPVVVEHGHLTNGAPERALLATLLTTPDTSLIYGAWRAGDGILGASPEILFRRLDDGRVATAAIAGTYPAERAAGLLTDPKELAEHQSVVDDIVAALTPLGRVEVGERELLELPHIAHLKTDLVLSPSRPPSFEALVQALHPTAAVGVAPRGAADLLRRLDATVGRERLGAPFGIEWPDGRAVCLVAIRNVQWRGQDVALGAGGGVIAQSRLDAEWEELRLKRHTVKRMLGL